MPLEDCPYCHGVKTVSVLSVQLEHPSGVVYPSFFSSCQDCSTEYQTEENITATEAALDYILDR